MSDESSRALSQVLDQLEHTVIGDSIMVQSIVDALGPRSFASLMLVFALISTSPASTIPGITAAVACIEFLLVVQMIAGRRSLWLPSFIAHRRISTEQLCKGVGWLRKPVRVTEKILKSRLTVLVTPPWIYLPLSLILGLTLLMPFMEVIPMSGSIASAVIAFFAAGVLTRDGLLVLVSMTFLAAVPLAVWFFG